MKHKNTWTKTRKFLNDIHLWLGLISGIVIFFVCISGTIYTYNTEIVEASENHLHQISVANNNQKKTISELLAQIKTSDSVQLSSIQIPAAPHKSYGFQFAAADGNRRNAKIYYVNPYSGEVLGSPKKETNTRKFMGYMFSMHRWLLLDKIEKPIFGELPNRKLGSWITGICTILFTIGVLTGIVIWFPNKLRSWKQGLKIKTGGSWKRTNHDLHNTLGFYSFLILFLMGITGPFFSFEWYRNGLRKTLGTYKAPIEKNEGKKKSDHKREVKNPEKTILFTVAGIETMVQKADQKLPYKGNYQISFQEDKWVLSKNKEGFFAPAASDKIEFSPNGDQILRIEKFSDKAFNEKISSSIKALHLGSVFGGFSKLLYFISCLIATSLPVTGTLIWLNKMKKKK